MRGQRELDGRVQSLSVALGQALFTLPPYVPIAEGENEVWFQIEISGLELMTLMPEAIVAQKLILVRLEAERLLETGQIRLMGKGEQVRVLWTGFHLFPGQDGIEGRLIHRHENKEPYDAHHDKRTGR